MIKWKKLTKDDPTLKLWMETDIRDHVKQARWYGGKASKDRAFYTDHLLPIDWKGQRYYLLMLEILYEQGFVQHYLLPIARVKPEDVEKGSKVIAHFPDKKYVLVDAVHVAGFRQAIFVMMNGGSAVDLGGSKLVFDKGKALRQFKPGKTIKSTLLNAEQSNTTIIYEGQFFFKLYRRLFRDLNPDIEVSQYLSEDVGYKNLPAFACSVTWSRKGIYDVSLGMMQAKVENKGEAWTWMLAHMKRSITKIRSEKIELGEIPLSRYLEPTPVEDVPELIQGVLSTELLKGIRKLAERTAEMHVAISSNQVNRNFSKTTYNTDYAVWLKNRIIYQFEARYALLERNFAKLTPLGKHYAEFFQDKKTEIKNRVFAFDTRKLSCQRIRIHGDFHLGQVLVSDDDFFILDFEGEPESTIHDRKVKESSLKDVASMFRSFHYAIYSTIFELNLDQENRKEMFEVGERLYHVIVNVFLDGYLKVIFNSHLNLGYMNEIRYLLNFHILEKAIYELGYELNARPSWSIIPLRGIFTILSNKD